MTHVSRDKKIEVLYFSNIINRGDGRYDIAEIPRSNAYTTLNLKRESINEITIQSVNIKYRELMKYTYEVIHEILENSINACSNEKLSKGQVIIENPSIIYKIQPNERIYFIRYYIEKTSFFNVTGILPLCSLDLHYLWRIRCSSLKGVMRYALFKVIVLYSLHYRLLFDCCISDKLLDLFKIFSYILIHDDESIILRMRYKERTSEHMKTILVLPSLVFGSGTNRSLIMIHYTDSTRLNNSIIYSINIQFNSMISALLLSKMLNKFKNDTKYDNDFSIKHLLYGLVCIIIGSLNYISYLYGPLVPVLPKYRLFKDLADSIKVKLLIPQEFRKYDVIKLADRFLRYYVCNYLLKNPNF